MVVSVIKGSFHIQNGSTIILFIFNKTKILFNYKYRIVFDCEKVYFRLTFINFVQDNGIILIKVISRHRDLL